MTETDYDKILKEALSYRKAALLAESQIKKKINALQGAAVRTIQNKFGWSWKDNIQEVSEHLAPQTVSWVLAYSSDNHELSYTKDGALFSINLDGKDSKEVLIPSSAIRMSTEEFNEIVEESIKKREEGTRIYEQLNADLIILNNEAEIEKLKEENERLAKLLQD